MQLCFKWSAIVVLFIDCLYEFNSKMLTTWIFRKVLSSRIAVHFLGGSLVRPPHQQSQSSITIHRDLQCTNYLMECMQRVYLCTNLWEVKIVLDRASGYPKLSWKCKTCNNLVVSWCILRIQSQVVQINRSISHPIAIYKCENMLLHIIAIYVIYCRKNAHDPVAYDGELSCSVWVPVWVRPTKAKRRNGKPRYLWQKPEVRTVIKR